MTEQQLIDQGYKDGKKSFEFYTREFFDNFDFEKVHKVMMATNWVWSFHTHEDGTEDKGVPDLNTIHNHAYKLLKEAYDNGNHVSTGGFTAGWENGELYLSFTLEEFSL